MAMPETLQTKRLSLRLLGPTYIDVVHALFSSDGHTIGDGPINDSAVSLAWLQQRSRLHGENGLAWYGLWDRIENFVGTCGAFLGRCGEEPEIGYEVAVTHRRQGYASEAAAVVTQACHTAGHVRIWATIRPANIGSVRILQANKYFFSRSEPDPRGPLDYYRHEVESLNQDAEAQGPTIAPDSGRSLKIRMPRYLFIHSCLCG